MLELPVANPGVLTDLDTPEDFARLIADRFHHPLTNVSS